LRVFILALDGLEFNLVEEWNLKYLKQKTYGKIEMGREYYAIYDVPYTPVVWHSFITGLPPERHKITSPLTYGRLLDKLRKATRFIRGKGKIARMLGIRPRTLTKRDYSQKTIFDAVPNSVAIDVPTYNLENWMLNFSHKRLEDFISYVWKEYYERKRKTLEALKSPNWKLIMSYIRIADILGHSYFIIKKPKLRECYMELNQLSKQIKDLLPENTVMLIISDHGTQASSDGVTGVHSKHAFWSLNIETDWKPQDITDFFDKILKWAKSET